MKALLLKCLAILLAPALFLSGWLACESVNALGIDFDVERAFAARLQRRSGLTEAEYNALFRLGFQTEMGVQINSRYCCRLEMSGADDHQTEALTDGQMACRQQMALLASEFGELRVRQALHWRHQSWVEHLFRFQRRTVFATIATATGAFGILVLVTILNRNAKHQSRSELP